MASKILAITKKTIPAGKTNAGQVYYELDCFVGSMTNPRAAKRCVFMTGNAAIDKMVCEHYDAIIANDVMPTIDLRYVVVGDRENNPQAVPLPPFRVKSRNGEVMPAIHTSMQVLMEFENGLMLGSARNQALRMIESLCVPVQFSEVSPVVDDHDPLSKAPAL